MCGVMQGEGREGRGGALPGEGPMVIKGLLGFPGTSLVYAGLGVRQVCCTCP